MSRVSQAASVPLEPSEALELWTDVRRWPSFIEGFARLVECDTGWPEPGSKLTWQSVAGGRGRVTERVVEHDPGARFATRVFEEALTGSQRAEVAAVEAEGTVIEVALEYELASGGPLRPITDRFFIRRALGDALRRTLRRYVIEAWEQAAL